VKAIAVEPHKPDTAHLADVPEPGPRDRPILVQAIAVGECGTSAASGCLVCYSSQSS
jgi:hypothetical protein